MYFLDHHESGLGFSQNTRPTYSDFAYLAFTIGMSYAVSDIEPTSTEIRRKSCRTHSCPTCSARF
jgi:uncharacterized membrane protein